MDMSAAIARLDVVVVKIDLFVLCINTFCVKGRKTKQHKKKYPTNHISIFAKVTKGEA